MVISPTASDRDLRYTAMWWRRKGHELIHINDAAERARYFAGAEQIERERTRRAKASGVHVLRTATSGD